MFNFSRIAAPLACLAVLAACGGSAPSVPVDAAEPATPVADPVPVTAASVLTSLDADAVCDVLSMALSTKDTKVSDDGCTAVPGESGVTLTSADGAQTLLAPLAQAGATVQVTAVNASAAAVENAVSGGFTNVGMVFIGRAPQGGLCMKAQYLAPDGSSNSLFVWRFGDADRVAFDLSKHATDTLESYFPQPLIPAGQAGVFTLHRREPGVVLKSVAFLDCSQVPAGMLK